MKTKSKIVVSALLVMALCVSLIAGTTFALFTSESGVDITVKSGKVDVKAEIKNLATSSLGEAQENGAWANGGKASVTGGTVTLDKITPGDSVSFNIAITNNTDINAKYRVSYLVENGYLLASGLDITVGDLFDGTNKYKKYATAWNDELSATVPVTITLPNHTDSKIDNLYMGLSAKISFLVEAVQANGIADDGKAEFELLPDFTEAKEAFLSGQNVVVASVSSDFGKLVSYHRNIKSGYYVLSKDITTAVFDTLCVGDGKVVIDLNGYSLNRNVGRDGNIYASGLQLNNNAELTIKNGTYASADKNYNLPANTNLSAIVLRNNAQLTMTNVDFSAYSGIFADVESSAVNIDNCKMEIRDPYSAAIATNATTNYQPTINVRDTVIKSAGTGVMMNVNGVMNVTNCDITAGFQCVQVRGGVGNVQNCKLNCLASAEYWNSLFESGAVWASRNKEVVDGQHKFLMQVYGGKSVEECTEAWGQSNAVAPGCVVVGNYKNTAYPYNAACTVDAETTFKVADGMQAWTVVVAGHPTEGIVDTVNYNGSVTVTQISGGIWNKD